MSVHLRGKYFHFDVKVNGKRQQGSTKKTTEDAAREYEAEFVKELERALEEAARKSAAIGVAAGSEVPTVGEVARQVASVKGVLRVRSVLFRRMLVYIASQIGEARPVTDITDDVIYRLVVGENIKKLLHVQRDYTDFRTIDEHLLANVDLADRASNPTSIVDLEQICEELTEDGLDHEPQRTPLANAAIKHSIIDPAFAIVNHALNVLGIPLPRRPIRKLHSYPAEYRHQTLSYEDEIVFKAHSNPEHWPLWIFAIESMLRKTNLIELNWQQVDLDAGRINLIVKGNKRFVRNITPSMRAILVDQKRKRLHDHYVFVWSGFAVRGDKSDHNNRKYLPVSQTRCTAVFNDTAKAAGLKDLRLHDLRRTGATRLYNASKDIDAVKDALGHSHVNTTWIYIGERSGEHEGAEFKREYMDDIRRSHAEARAAGEEPTGMSPGEEAFVLGLAVNAAAAPAVAISRLIDRNPGLTLRDAGGHVRTGLSSGAGSAIALGVRGRSTALGTLADAPDLAPRSRSGAAGPVPAGRIGWSEDVRGDWDHPTTVDAEQEPALELDDEFGEFADRAIWYVQHEQPPPYFRPFHLPMVYAVTVNGGVGLSCPWGRPYPNVTFPFDECRDAYEVARRAPILFVEDIKNIEQKADAFPAVLDCGDRAIYIRDIPELIRVLRAYPVRPDCELFKVTYHLVDMLHRTWGAEAVERLLDD